MSFTLCSPLSVSGSTVRRSVHCRACVTDSSTVASMLTRCATLWVPLQHAAVARAAGDARHRRRAHVLIAHQMRQRQRRVGAWLAAWLALKVR
jgi:hypothetical protein